MGAKPASHHKSSFTDMQSITLIGNILTGHGRVMPNLSAVDKWPNIDGRVEVQDEEANLIGPLSVQAKTLPVNHDLKFPCPVTFLSYCEIEPCMLLGVDNQSERVYWRYFDSQEVQEIDFKKNKHTKTLYFDGAQYFDKSQTGYIKEWSQIIEKNKIRLKEYDEVKDAYDKLRKNSNEIVGVVDKKFIKIHLFLDELNKKYDLEFPTAKSFFYPKTWKLGLAYENYGSTKIGYTIFPIPWDKNDVQIKKVDPQLAEQVREGGLGFTGHFKENPIEDRPVDYAKEVAGSKVQKIVEKKLLSHVGSEVLAREFVVAFIDMFHEQMGLPEKDEYKIAEVNFAFNEYLPHWVEEAYKFMLEKDRNNIREQIARRGYFDPDVLWQLRPEEREEIRQKVNKSWEKPARVIMANQKLDIGVFVEFLDYLKRVNQPITRVYKKPDFKRLQGNGWVWNKYSAEDAAHNLNVVFRNLEDAYKVVIARNFPNLQTELDLFGKADEIAVNYTVRDKYKSRRDGPTYRMFYLQAKSYHQKKSIKFINNEQADRLRNLIFQNDLKIDMYDNQSFKLLGAQHSILDFLYEETPLLNLVYQLLENRLKQYLGNK